MHVNKLMATIERIAYGLLLATHLAHASPTQPASTEASKAFDSIVAEQMKASGIVGLAAAIIVNNQVVWTQGYGLADQALGRPFTTDTIMNVGSISKPFLGVAMMRAVHEGKLSLDEDINTYLPFRVVNPHYPEAIITLRHLATHTSGITDRGEVYKDTYHFGGDSPEPLGEFLKQYFATDGTYYSRENFLDAKPGGLRDYCNICAGLAGLIVERAFGEPLNVYTRTHIFEPLKMTRSGWFMSEVDLSQHSKLYVSHHSLIIPIPLYGGTTYPDGGVRTSVSDLAKFFIALLNDGQYEGSRILDVDSTAEMLRFQFSDSNRPENFPAADGNSGLFWRTKFNGTLIGHGGNDPGIQTEMLADLSKQVGIILFVNTSLSGPEQQASGIVFDALWKHAAALQQTARIADGK